MLPYLIFSLMNFFTEESSDFNVYPTLDVTIEILRGISLSFSDRWRAECKYVAGPCSRAFQMQNPTSVVPAICESLFQL